MKIILITLCILLANNASASSGVSCHEEGVGYFSIILGDGMIAQEPDVAIIVFNISEKHRGEKISIGRKKLGNKSET